MHAMADLGDGATSPRPTSPPSSGHDQPSRVSPQRDGLLTKGLIYAPERGLLAFTVPHMAAYLRQLAGAPVTAASPSDRAFGVRLAVITAVGAVWRLGYLFAVKIDDPLLLNDSLYYSIQAGRNSEGDWFREALTALPGAEHGPLTSLYLTPWSLGAGDNVGLAAVRHDAARHRHRRRHRPGRPAPGRCRASVSSPPAIAAVYPNLWINDSLVMSESLAVPARRRGPARRPRLRPPPGAGPGRRCSACSSGSARLTRSELALFAVGFAGLAWWRAAGHPPPGADAGARASVATVRDGRAVGALQPRPLRAARCCCRRTTARRCSAPTATRRTTTTSAGWDIRCLGAGADRRTAVDASVRSAERRDVAVDYVGDHLGRVPVVVAARRRAHRSTCTASRSLVALDVGEEKAEWAVWVGDRLLVGPRRRRRSSGWRGARRPATGRRAVAGPLVARRARSPRCSSRRCCSTAPTASGPRPSRWSSCSPPSASSPCDRRRRRSAVDGRACDDRARRPVVAEGSAVRP